MSAFFAAWRLALRIVRLTFRAQLEYRAEFWLKIGYGLAWQVSIIVFATVLIGRFPGMGGWPSEAVLLIAAMRLLSHGLLELIFGRVVELALLIQDGRFDAFLLRPMPVYRQVLLAEFNNYAIGDLLVGATMFAGAVYGLDLHWTPLLVLYLVAALIGGMLVEAAVHTTVSSLHLHFTGALSWTYWIVELFGTFGNYPLKILPGALNYAFTFLLPMAFIAYLPIAVLTGNTTGLGVPVALAAAAPLVGLAAFIGSRLLWNKSLRHYAGVNA